ncbi:MAG: hypothetical protein QM718_05675 [Steroidobacteraceae bacterium]
MKTELLPGMVADLAALALKDPKAWAQIVVLLGEAEADPEILAKLTTPGSVEIGPKKIELNVQGWRTAKRQGDNLSRLRLADPHANMYRIIYGFDWRHQTAGYLAIVKRVKDSPNLATGIENEAEIFDYDNLSGPLWERIQDDWRTATGGQTT